MRLKFTRGGNVQFKCIFACIAGMAYCCTYRDTYSYTNLGHAPVMDHNYCKRIILLLHEKYNSPCILLHLLFLPITCSVYSDNQCACTCYTMTIDYGSNNTSVTIIMAALTYGLPPSPIVCRAFPWFSTRQKTLQLCESHLSAAAK
jgi:hypothetical protein